jgi:anti-sigma B factor antagonist
VVNAKEVSVIDSSGVGDLVASFSLVKKSGGSLKVANPTKLVRDVLRIARIPTIIEFFDTEEEALKAFEN